MPSRRAYLGRRRGYESTARPSALGSEELDSIGNDLVSEFGTSPTQRRGAYSRIQEEICSGREKWQEDPSESKDADNGPHQRTVLGGRLCVRQEWDDITDKQYAPCDRQDEVDMTDCHRGCVTEDGKQGKNAAIDLSK